MYPFIRAAWNVHRARRQSRLDRFDLHISHHRIWPTDIDPWIELNNGRTLTLFDLGRLALFTRIGVTAAARQAGLYLTVAGLSVRYRARVRPFTRIEMRSQVAGWDHRFVYVVQSMWQGETCANQALIRTAIARQGKGIVPPAEALALMGYSSESPPLPDWICNWSAADATRPWPPVEV